ncbi:MAG: VOC family protein [Kordiimonadaceae bacterium]|nr:VOC family protein [Kordiimonadaceae bacterium]
MDINAFHLALHVPDLKMAKEYYGNTLGCTIGRQTELWVDFDFFGHQLTLHLGAALPSGATGTDGERSVPMPHFGAILSIDNWQTLANRLKAADVRFIIEPTVRFRGKPGEQSTMFFRDPFGYALEFKGFAQQSQIFET